MIEITIIFFLLTIKHAVADLGLQSILYKSGKIREKDHYFGGHVHYLHHAIGTFLTFIWFVDLHMTCVLTVIDYVSHWHIDFAKQNINKHFKLTTKDSAWWWVAALDQALHYLTYFLLVLYVIS